MGNRSQSLASVAVKVDLMSSPDTGPGHVCCPALGCPVSRVAVALLRCPPGPRGPPRGQPAEWPRGTPRPADAGACPRCDVSRGRARGPARPARLEAAALAALL